MQRGAAVVLACIVLLSCDNRRAKRAEINRLVTQIRSDLARNEKDRTPAIAAALETLAPRPDLGKCSVALEQTVRDERANRFVVIRAGAPLGPSSVLERARKETDQVVTNISFAERKGVELDWDLDSARKIAAQLASGYEVVLVQDERVDAALSRASTKGEPKFTPGRLRGRAFLYSYATGRVACAASVDATSSREVDVRFSLGQPGGPGLDMAIGLSQDLTANAMAVAEANMVAAGPKSVSAPAEDLHP
jgi:hypothetical protein